MPHSCTLIQRAAWPTTPIYPHGDERKRRGAEGSRRRCFSHHIVVRSGGGAARECPVATVRQAASDDELEQCANIRAVAYFEAMPSPPRMIVSAQRQIARDEFSGLVRRTAQLPNSGHPKAVCLVALSEEGSVLGSLDIRPPATLTGKQPKGVPQDEFGAFLNNVAVHKRFRGRGVGTCLVAAALEVAAGQLQARRLYTQVDCDNPPALALYDRHGFVRVEGSQDTCKLPSGRYGLVANLAQDSSLTAADEQRPDQLSSDEMATPVVQ